ncbi:hypothetical protein Tco_0749946 [Tanacetum coccineum]|uniref:Uncharacterized protein n=1 Tax=Tanacetum coccineum TaxID=301880 RepID=A0ABQ4Z0W6_9ASTR
MAPILWEWRANNSMMITTSEHKISDEFFENIAGQLPSRHGLRVATDHIATFDNYWEIEKNTKNRLWEFYVNKCAKGTIGDLDEYKEPCKRTCSDTFYKPYLDAQEAKDIYEVMNREYSPIPIPYRREIDNPDELCRTEENHRPTKIREKGKALLPDLPLWKRYQGTSELVEDDDEEDKEIEGSLDSNNVRKDAKDEGPTVEDEDPVARDEGLATGDEGPGMGAESRGLDDESHGLDDESHSVESDGLGSGEEEEAVPEG